MRKRTTRDQPLGLQVQAHQCETCIYFKKSGFDIKDLEAQLADRYMEGHFRGFRACHHAPGRSVCCRGFWDRHKDHFDGGQLAQRLGLVIVVDIDTAKRKNAKPARRR